MSTKTFVILISKRHPRNGYAAYSVIRAQSPSEDQVREVIHQITDCIIHIICPEDLLPILDTNDPPESIEWPPGY